MLWLNVDVWCVWVGSCGLGYGDKPGRGVLSRDACQ